MEYHAEDIETRSGVGILKASRLIYEYAQCVHVVSLLYKEKVAGIASYHLREDFPPHPDDPSLRKDRLECIKFRVTAQEYYVKKVFEAVFGTSKPLQPLVLLGIASFCPLQAPCGGLLPGKSFRPPRAWPCPHALLSAHTLTLLSSHHAPPPIARYAANCDMCHSGQSLRSSRTRFAEKKNKRRILQGYKTIAPENAISVS
jgi:hypothetical protein